MTTTHKQLEGMMAADSLLTSMGVLCPVKPSSLDAALSAAWTKARDKAMQTDSPVPWEYVVTSPFDRDQS